MTTLKDVLQAADPMRHEQSDLAARRDHIRRRVVSEADEPPIVRMGRIGRPDLRRRRTSFAISGALALLVAAGISSRLAQPTSVQAAVRFEVHLAEEQSAP